MSKNKNIIRVALVALAAVFAAAACDTVPGPIPPIPGLDGSGTTTAPLTTYQHADPDIERWHSAAIAAGWTEAEWPTLGCIIQGESQGNPHAYNGRNRDRSYGLTQMNTKAKATRDWLFARGLNMVQDLWEPLTNLIFAKLLSNETASASWAGYDKWQPWRSAGHRRTCFTLEGAVNAP